MVSLLAVPVSVSDQGLPTRVAAMAAPERATKSAATVRTTIAVRLILRSFRPVPAGLILGPIGPPVRASLEAVFHPGEGATSSK